MDGHRKLKAWQRCRAMAVAVYKATKPFPADERFGIVSQLRRAAVSPAANIAEGYGRRGRKELKRFLGIALGSLSEIDTLLAISHDLRYLSDRSYLALREMYKEASKTTYGLLKRTRRP